MMWSGHPDGKIRADGRLAAAHVDSSAAGSE